MNKVVLPQRFYGHHKPQKLTFTVIDLTCPLILFQPGQVTVDIQMMISSLLLGPATANTSTIPHITLHQMSLLDVSTRCLHQMSPPICTSSGPHLIVVLILILLTSVSWIKSPTVNWTIQGVWKIDNFHFCCDYDQ